MCYKHQFLVHKGTSEHPIFLAAAMIHRSSTSEVYQHFLFQIKQVMRGLKFDGSIHTKLDTSSTEQVGDADICSEGGGLIIYGSDEELAIVKV